MYREIGDLRDIIKLDCEERIRHNKAMEVLLNKKIHTKQRILELELARLEVLENS